MNKLSEMISIDDANNIVTFDGVQIHGDLLRNLTQETPVGQYFRVFKRDRDIVYLETVYFNPDSVEYSRSIPSA